MQAPIAVPQPPRAGEHTRNAGAVILVVAVALAMGWLLLTSVEGRSSTFTSPDAAISLAYPAAWTETKAEDGTLLSIADRYSPGIRPTFKVYVRGSSQDQRLVDAATAWTMNRMYALPEFRDLGAEETTLADRPAIALNYAYVAEPPAGAGPATLPIVARARDTIVLLDGKYVVFSATGNAALNNLDPQFARILASVKLAGK
jgi:hypothetical protein